MDRAKLIDKIQKCLALSASPEPYEAAAALRQAQKLIAKHGVTDAELGLASYASEKVNCPIQAGKTMPDYLGALISLMQQVFGVKATVHREIRVSDASWCVTYYGKADRVALAAYSHPVCWRAVCAAWNAYAKEREWVKGVRGGRAGFLLGWFMGVKQAVSALVMDDSEQEELTRYLESEVPGITASAPVKATETTPLKSTVMAGLRAAKDFSLHRPLGG